MLDATKPIGEILKEVRNAKQLSLQDVAKQVNIDYTLLNRIENGKRLPTKEHIEKLADFYRYNKEELMKAFLSDKILYEIKDEDYAYEALKIAEKKIVYHYTLFPEMDNGIFKLESRRYIGNKAKLTDWIMEIIQNETYGADTFIDIFAGTASVAKQAMKNYKKVILNDILYSNHIIYKAFFKPEKWDKEKIIAITKQFNEVNPENLDDNYFSINYGNRFFEYSVAKKIGHIREEIEKLKHSLNEKEYAILLASMIYSMDKVANTVGHFDAYIKKPIKKTNFYIQLIQTYDFEGIEIYREDANVLARKIKGDIAYIDPPYNSRQYSRFYHVYENFVKWDKPALFGIARKPKPENMSKYCTVKAKDTFRDLVENLDVKYLAVSYNNTYNSKSKSSENKIKLDEIFDILSKIGKTKVFEQKHKFFTTGKTNFNNHKEYLFITKKQ